MECLLAFLCLLAFATFAIRAAAGEGSTGKRRRGYQQVAKQFSGRFSPGGWFGQPLVRFRYGDTFVVLGEATLRATHPVRCTQLRINWADNKVRAELVSRGGQTNPIAARGMTAIETEDTQFDDCIAIRASDELEMKRFLSDGVRWQIVRLAELSGDHDLYVSIDAGYLYVQTSKLLRSFEALKIFIENSLALYDQAMITRAVGIEFVDDGEAVTLEHVICKVCGEEIGGEEMVYCGRCKTPHHAECWQYAGACSVYGCLEKTCRRPQAATAVNQQRASDTDGPSSSTEGLSS